GRVHVAGIGDRPEAAHLVPALTTADTAARTVGERAARLLLERVEGRGGASADVPAAALRPRASTGHW
uniref:substrate-binding domain-containing protein n=1 Tax=Nocardiopsis sp. CC223A TaxID=3044051 RepID=UPI00278BD764